MRKSLAMRVSAQTLIGNIILSVGKLAAGIIAHSGAMVSDAVHSASDAVSTIIVMLGLRISEKEADQAHPYGHERFECVCSAVLAVLLLFTGVTIGKSAAEKLFAGAEIAIPGVLALIMAVVSVLAKEGMYQYTMWAAKKVNSTVLKADAWHHRSDALSSIGSFIGILGARLGFLWMDALASLIICCLILKVGVDILRDAMNGMLDSACDAQTEANIRDVVAAIDGVERIDLLSTRMFGSKIYVDVEIAAAGTLSLSAAHQIAENVHNAVEVQFENVKHCMVHVNPIE